MKITKDTRIYIAGCGGMLGEAVYGRFSSIARVKATDIDLNEAWLSYADVRDYPQVLNSIEDFNPHVVMNLAAITDLELCEKDPEKAWMTNALGAENLGLIANKLDIPYVYMSSAGVFGGEKEIYHDFDDPNPLGCYAKSKYYGEVFIRQHVRKHYVLRAGWMMGGGYKKDKKFINKIYKQLLEGKRRLHVVDDKFGAPTYTIDFAHGIHALLESGLYGLYNQVCGDSCSRYDVALEFIRLLGLEDEIEVQRVSSDFFKSEYFAPRPTHERLVNMKLTARGMNVMRDWRECLKEYSELFVSDLSQRMVKKSRPLLQLDGSRGRR